MRQFRRFTALLLIMLMIAAAFGSTALAAKPRAKASTPAVEALTLNKQYTLQKYDKAPIYRLTVKKDSLITLSWSGNAASSISLNLYTDKSCKNVAGSVSTYDKAKGSLKLVFPQGTYYVRMYDYNQKGKVKFTSKAISYPKNYSPSRAKALKARKKTTVPMAPLGAFPLWYKLTLAKAKAITVSMNDVCSVQLFDADLEQITDLMYSSTYVATNDALPAGSYYLRIIPDDPYYDVFQAMEFSWS